MYNTNRSESERDNFSLIDKEKNKKYVYKQLV